MTDKIVFLAVLIVVAIFFLRKMFHPPKGNVPALRTIRFYECVKKKAIVTDLGNCLHTIYGTRGYIWPISDHLWTTVSIFENGILLKRNRKDKVVFYSDIHSMEPFLINSLFVKGKHYGYELKMDGGDRVQLRSNDLKGLDSLIQKLCDLFPWESAYRPEVVRYTIKEDSLVVTEVPVDTNAILPLNFRKLFESETVNEPEYRLLFFCKATGQVIRDIPYFAAISRLEEYVIAKKENCILVRGLRREEIEQLAL